MTQLSTDEFAMCYVLMSFVHIMGPVAHVYSSAAIEDSVTAETCLLWLPHMLHYFYFLRLVFVGVSVLPAVM